MKNMASLRNNHLLSGYIHPAKTGSQQPQASVAIADQARLAGHLSPLNSARLKWASAKIRFRSMQSTTPDHTGQAASSAAMRADSNRLRKPFMPLRSLSVMRMAGGGKTDAAGTLSATGQLARHLSRFTAGIVARQPKQG